MALPIDTTPEGGIADALGLFGRSTVSSAGELFGSDPSAAVRGFRADNPIAGAASQILGTAAPYLGWAAVGTKIPGLRNLMGSAEGLVQSNFLKGALADATLFAPLEASRTLVGTTLGGERVGDMLADNALGLGLGAAAGGVVRSLSGQGKVLKSVAGYVDEAHPAQMMIRDLGQKLADPTLADPVVRNSLAEARVKLAKLVREEVPESRLVYDQATGAPTRKVLQFVGNLGDKEKTRQVNRLFNAGHALKANPEGFFKSDFDWKDVGMKAGFGEDFEAFVKTPRFVPTPTKGKGAKNFQAALRTGLQDIGDGVHLARETDDGLYVMAKRIKDETHDGYMLFKTDSPEKFAPGAARWTERIEGTTNWMADRAMLQGQSKLLDTSMAAMGKIAGSKMPEKVRNEVVDALGKAADKYVKPRMFQLPGSGIGRGALMAMQMTFDSADAMARRLAYGRKELDPGKGALSQVVFTNLKEEGRSIRQILQEAEKNGDMPAISRILTEELTAPEVAAMYERGEIGTAAKEFFEFSKAAHGVFDAEIMPLQKITGIEKYVPRQNHWGVPRVRPGDQRIRVLNKQGDTVALVGGETTAEANAIADEILAKAAEDGFQFTKSAPFLRDERLDTSLLEEYGKFDAKGPDRAYAARLLHNAVKSGGSGSNNFRPRHNVEGYTKDWTADTLTKAWADHAQTKMKYAASLASREALGQYMDKMTAISGSHAFDVVSRRLEDFEGKAGGLSKAVNSAFDKALAPVLGKNSASSIVNAVNKYYMHMTLGAGNFAYPVLNALGYLQTVMPHLAYVKNAPPHLLNQLYDTSLMSARNGVQSISHLSPMKMMAAATKQLTSNEPEWLKSLGRAMNDGSIDPKFIEEYVGQNSEKFANIRENLKSPAGWARTIRDMSLLVMESGEKFSRAHAFSTGYTVGKLLFKEPEQIYQFAKQFTDNTMFRYATPDRPTLFAGPVGTTFGLFKNWMMHYMMSTLRYAQMGMENPKSMAAWNPLLWQIAGTTAVGGVGAWPLYSLADNFSSFVSDKPLQEHIYSNMNEPMADAMYYGLPSLLGLSLSSQAQMPFHSPLQDAEFMFFPVHLDRMAALARAAGDSVDRWDATGRFNPLGSQKLQLEWAQALAPKTVYRALQNQTDGLIRSGRTGQPLVKNVGTLDKIGYAFGMTPIEVDRMYKASEYLWNSNQERTRMIGALGQEWKEASDVGDYRAVEDVMRRAIQMGIDPGRVAKSAQQRLRREEQDMLEYQFTPEQLWRVTNMTP